MPEVNIFDRFCDGIMSVIKLPILFPSLYPVDVADINCPDKAVKLPCHAKLPLPTTILVWANAALLPIRKSLTCILPLFRNGLPIVLVKIVVNAGLLSPKYGCGV